MSDVSGCRDEKICVSCSVKLEPEGSNLEEGDSWAGVGVFDVQGNLDIRR